MSPYNVPEVAPVRNLDTRSAINLELFVGKTERIAYNTFATIKTADVIIPISSFL